MRKLLSPLFAGRLRRRPRRTVWRVGVVPHAMNPTESRHGTGGAASRVVRAILASTVPRHVRGFLFRYKAVEGRGLKGTLVCNPWSTKHA